MRSFANKFDCFGIIQNPEINFFQHCDVILSFWLFLELFMIKVNTNGLRSCQGLRRNLQLAAISGGRFFYEKKSVMWYCFTYEPRSIRTL